MTAVFITVYRQRTQPKIYEERSVQGQINQIIYVYYSAKHKRKCHHFPNATQSDSLAVSSSLNAGHGSY